MPDAITYGQDCIVMTGHSFGTISPKYRDTLLEVVLHLRPVNIQTTRQLTTRDIDV